MNFAEKIYNYAKESAAKQGKTVELFLDADKYTGAGVDKVLYGTPENDAVPIIFAKSLVPGKMSVFTTPAAVADAQRIIAQIESGE